LYGDLSSKSHLDPKNNRHYIGKKNGTTFVRYKLHGDVKIILYYLIHLAIDFEKLINKISGKYFDYTDSCKTKEIKDFLKSATEILKSELS